MEVLTLLLYLVLSMVVLGVATLLLRGDKFALWRWWPSVVGLGALLFLWSIGHENLGVIVVLGSLVGTLFWVIHLGEKDGTKPKAKTRH